MRISTANDPHEELAYDKDTSVAAKWSWKKWILLGGIAAEEEACRQKIVIEEWVKTNTKGHMQLNEYQEKAHGTSRNTEINGSKLTYPLFGIAGETGEVFEKMKKRYRDHADGTKVTDAEILNDKEFLKMLQKELGDVLWYIAETHTQLGLDLGETASMNIEKLYSRKDRGVITGSGDNR